jgi:hypothetical protein
MPINDPIQNRKVAPGSLAFERRRMVYGSAYAGEEPEGDVYNYQYYIDLNYNITINNIVNKTFLNTETNKILTSMQNAEERAKHYVSDYKQSFQWDLNGNWSFMTDVYTPVPFNNEFLRTQGIQNESLDYDDTWSFRPTDQNKGVWWVHTYVQIRYSNTSQVDEARLAYFVNGVMFRIIDMVDYHNMGDGPHIRDARLMGGAHIPLRAGDKLEVKMIARTGGPSEEAGVLFPSSIYAYITGHRENCELNTTGNTATDGNGYVFYKGAEP